MGDIRFSYKIFFFKRRDYYCNSWLKLKNSLLSIVYFFFKRRDYFWLLSYIKTISYSYKRKERILSSWVSIHRSDQKAWAAKILSRSSWGTGSPLLCLADIFGVWTNVFHLSCFRLHILLEMLILFNYLIRGRMIVVNNFLFFKGYIFWAPLLLQPPSFVEQIFLFPSRLHKSK